MNKYLAQFAELEWSKVLVIGLGVAAAYYFLLYDSGSVLEANIRQSQTRLAAAKTALQQTERAIEDANRFEKEVQATNRQFEKIVEFMPPAIGAAELTAIINKQAQASGVSPRITPKGEDPASGFYQISRVDLQLDGSFAQIVSFLSNISRVPRLLTFDKVVVKMPPAGSSGSLTFNGTLLGYRYLKDAPDAGTAKASAPEIAPAAKGRR